MNAQETVQEYITKVAEYFATGNATEPTYRPALQRLLEELLRYTVIHEPKHLKCGAPDYILKKDDLPVAIVEAKDINDPDLDGNRKNKEQFDRYKAAFNHVLFTDYLDFHLYVAGEFAHSIRIAEVRGGNIVLIQENVEQFLQIFEMLANAVPQKITTSKQLAETMAAKAKLLRHTIQKTLEQDHKKEGDLASLLDTFKELLIHDLTEEKFADIYAQTIVYGMFAARLQDKTPDTFSVEEAARLIPGTNPFLQGIFRAIAGFKVDDSIVWIVEALAEMFRAIDLPKVMEKFGRSNGQKDPLIYFYEDFLKKYNPKEKIKNGVFYTPDAVADFIVNSVDDILKCTFNIPNGLADTSTIKANEPTRNNDKEEGERCAYIDRHRVQILDPAVGTATFPAKIVKKIFESMQGNQGAWQDYVDRHLLPRLNGFEFMMAPYVIAHLKLNMIFSKTPYSPSADNRLRIFLTNSLEECEKDVPSFWQWLARETNEANNIKRHARVMVMVGNPPYSSSSANKGSGIQKLLEDYKKGLRERRNQQNDDYIKFIRLAQHYVDHNGEGTVAYITNNSFINGVTHRQMRKSLLDSFNEIYILNLHGSKRNSDVSQGVDENVFDIKQGVCISFFIKSTSSHYNVGRVFYSDLYGTREGKYHYLQSTSFRDVSWKELAVKPPYYFFIPKNLDGVEEYDKGFSVAKMFPEHTSGLQTKRDRVNVFFSKEEAECVKHDFLTLTEAELKNKYDLENGRDWSIANAKRDLEKTIVEDRIDYRPFDIRWTNYTGTTKGIMGYPRRETNQHIIGKENIALITCRQQSTFDFQHAFVSTHISDMCSISAQSKESSYVFPLYLYSDQDQEQTQLIPDDGRIVNLDAKLWGKLNESVGRIASPIEVFDYIYGVLYTPSYRAQFNEFLQIDFPKIPYPKNEKEFIRTASIGHKLRELHLMRTTPKNTTVAFNISGDNIIAAKKKGKGVRFEDGKVHINTTQYFENVPELAWNFYIGGYRPAQKWLADRAGRSLSYDDIEHYRQIISVLVETHRLMLELDGKMP